MGDNSKGQLGIGKPTNQGSPLPCFLDELSFTKMAKVRAGSYSASLCTQGNLFIWGEGIFGEFYTPRRVKSAKKLEIADF